MYTSDALTHRIATRSEQLEQELKRVRTAFLSKFSSSVENSAIIDTWAMDMRKTFLSNEWRINMLDDRKCQVINCYVELVERLIEEEKMSFDELTVEHSFTIDGTTHCFRKIRPESSATDIRGAIERNIDRLGSLESRINAVIDLVLNCEIVANLLPEYLYELFRFARGEDTAARSPWTPTRRLPVGHVIQHTGI